MSLTTEFTQPTQVFRQRGKINDAQEPASDLPRFPALEAALAKFLPLPVNGLFLGIAIDGLPVLLNLKDPRPGPLLLLGDGQTGKTDFLQGVAHAGSLAYRPGFLRFAVVTPFPEEWTGWEVLAGSLGVLKPADSALKNLLIELSVRAQEGGSDAALLLIDDLSSLMSLDFDLLEALRWLVDNGNAGQVWTIATLNTDQAVSLPNWLGTFHTRIFSRMEDPRLADQFTPMPGANLSTLLSGTQFCIRERNHWLRFGMPTTK
jgi:hypothetical protein